MPLLYLEVTQICGTKSCQLLEDFQKSGVVDAWEESGRPADAQYSWDVRLNDNLDWPYPNKPRIRFDRFFVRSAQGQNALKANQFMLVGMERIPGCRRFPSDHWGILCQFSPPINKL